MIITNELNKPIYLFLLLELYPIDFMSEEDHSEAVQIISIKYGANGKFKTDKTPFVNHYKNNNVNGKLSFNAGVCNSLFGDPVPNVVKDLIVTYTIYGSEELSFSMKEHQIFTFPPEEFSEFSKKNTELQELAKDFLSLTKTSITYDLTIKCGNLSLKGHKMFLTQCKKLQFKDDTVEIKDITESCFLPIYDYLYSGEIKISKENYVETIKASSQLGLDNLTNSILDFIIKTQCKPKNVLKLLVSGKKGAFGEVKVDDLMKKCDLLIAEEADEVFKSKDVILLDEEYILHMVKSSTYCIEEKNLANAVIRWGINQSKQTGKDLKQVLVNIMPHLRIPMVGGIFLVKKLKPLNIIPQEEYYKALEFMNFGEFMKIDEKDIIYQGRGDMTPNWDPKFCQNTAKIDKKKISFSTGTAFMTKANKFKLKIISGATWLMIGFKNANQRQSSTLSSYDYSQGYYMYGGGGLYGSPGQATSYSCPSVYGNGNIIGCVFDPVKKTISYSFNGKDYGVAYSNVNEKELYPVINISGNGTLEIVKK